MKAVPSGVWARTTPAPPSSRAVASTRRRDMTVSFRVEDQVTTQASVTLSRTSVLNRAEAPREDPKGTGSAERRRARRRAGSAPPSSVSRPPHAPPRDCPGRRSASGFEAADNWSRGPATGRRGVRTTERLHPGRRPGKGDLPGALGDFPDRRQMVSGQRSTVSGRWQQPCWEVSVQGRTDVSALHQRQAAFGRLSGRPERSGGFGGGYGGGRSRREPRW